MFEFIRKLNLSAVRLRDHVRKRTIISRISFALMRNRRTDSSNLIHVSLTLTHALHRLYVIAAK
jgi:hypothetical protein